MSLVTKDELSLINDNRYKLFLGSIEKVSKQLENATEWHDYIPNLKKLKKIIETYADFHSIPKRLTVMKQLSRCLHPSLPHGVHLETLSVYETIFQMLDKRFFQRDLLLYSYGLFPLLSTGAYPVKSVLLNIYETFFLPLGQALQPVLTGFLIGLFSSLEEDVENSQRLNILLENLIHQIDEFYFYTCLWSAMSFVGSVRYSASLFLLNHFDRQQPRDDQKFLKGFDEKTMINAICICLNGTNQSLAQRTILDFLSIYSPMNEKQFDSIQIKQILHSTLNLFLQRDASLNRRIYLWFLGSDADSTYFLLHTREILIETIIDALELVSICQIESSSHSEDERTNVKCQSVSATWTLTKLIQMLLVLIDKADVGPSIIESVFHHYLFVVYEQVYYSIRELNPMEIQQEKSAIETMKMFHLLLENLEPYFIWEYLTKIFYSIFNEKINSTVEQICGVISMLLEIYNFDSDEEIQSKYLPEMLKNLIEIIDKYLDEFNPKRLSLSLEMLMKINEKIRYEKQRRSLMNNVFDDEIHQILDEIIRKIEDSNDIGSSIIQQFQQYFHHFILKFLLNETEAKCEEKYRRFQTILHHSDENFASILNRYEENEEFYLNFHDYADEFIDTFEQSCQLFEKFDIDTENSMNYSNKWLIDLILLSICRNGSFVVRTRALIVLLRHSKHSLIEHFLHQTDFVSYLLADLWQHFKENSSIDEHRQTAKVLAILHDILPDDRCDRLIAQQLTNIDEFQRFFRLWNFTRETSIEMKSLENSLLTILNVLQTSDHYRLKSIVQQWISHCFTHNSTLFLSQINEIFQIFRRSTEYRREELVNQQRSNDENKNDDLTVPRTLDEEYDDEYMRDYQCEAEIRRSSSSSLVDSINLLSSSPKTSNSNETNSDLILINVQFQQFFYTKSIDFRRILIGLNIIENLLNLLSSQLIHRLFISSDGSRSYLCVLFEYLLIFIRSFSSDENETNVEVQLRSFSLLTRLCHELVSLARNGVLPLDQIHQLLRKVSLQKVLVHLFNGILTKKTPFIDEFLRLVAQMICLEHLICSNDADLFYQSLVNQTMFLSFILQYLKNLRFIEYHHFIFDFLIEILPFTGPTLKSIVIGTIEQLYRNLYYLGHVDWRKLFENRLRIDLVDYIVCAISYLSYICHYALGTSTLPSVPCVLHAVYPQQRLKPSFDLNLFDVRQNVFRKLPSVLSSLFFLWKTITTWSRRDVQSIRQQISSMISSLLKTNGVSVLRALAYCWAGRKRQSNSTILIRDHQGEIHALIDILINLHDYTITDMIANMNELIRSNDKRQELFTVWSFQFLLAYCEKQTKFSLDCWAKLATMFKECLNQPISFTVNSLMIRIWSLYIKEAISLIEKRDIKDVQEITMKLLENCNTIIGSVFEQSSWLRKPRPFLSLSSDEPMNSDNLAASLSALAILGEHATTLLDIVHKTSEEKDQVVVEFVQRLVKNILPFVRLRTQSNFVAHRSATILLKNLSEFSYTRDAWERKVLELFFDTNFFQTDLQSLKAWRILIANLISDEKSSILKEMIDRINRVQTSFFSSKENQNECALAMKRCAFILFVTEKDHCYRYLPEILKRIVELLKLPQTPILHTQIFLLFRTLAVRVSNKYFVAFWPIILTELIQIFLQLEQELLIDLNKETNFDVQRLTTSELNPPTLKLYLFACKLLDVLLRVSPSDLFYFQFCRQAFTGDDQSTNTDRFVTFAQRLANLFNEKVQLSSSSISTTIISRSMLRQDNISDISELYPFFYRLSTMNYSTDENSFHEKFDQSKESTILEDFIEPFL